MINRVTLVGRVGNDPEARRTGSGKAVTNFRLATDETYKDRSGERQKRTEWHTVVLWDRVAEIAAEYVKKGSLVYVEGRIQSRQYEGKEGTRVAYEIIADTLKMLDTRGERTEPATVKTTKKATAIADEDMPF